ncbi:MAG TPA: RidA family protein [Polyangiaceae bacterium]|nr:RidA family protein [Polyangiaceae bacterium]
MPKTIVVSEQAPKPVAAYSRAVRAGDFLFLSGQIPIDPATSELVAGDIQAQTRRVLENLRAVLAAANAGFQNVVKVSVFLTDMQDFAAFNAVYVTYFETEPPARATVAVSALPRGARIEIEAVAYLGA